MICWPSRIVSKVRQLPCFSDLLMTCRRYLPLLLLLLFVHASWLMPQARAQNAAKDWLQGEQLESLTRLYYYLHAHPELSFQEEQTAKRLGNELEKLGCEVTYNVGGFGVVGMLSNGSGPTVMVRTDLDGLPIIEQTNVPYASEVKVEDESGNTVGVMHACGHDVHMTNLIGVARYLGSCREQWQGTIMFVGQPAEERGSGAIAMLEDGLFERFPKPDYALALHTSSTMPTGQISVTSGYAMANVDSVDITVFGRGGHGAYPHTTIDPIVEAARLVLDLQTIVAREVKPIEPAVITVGSIHAGTKHNIISDQCHLQLTVRSYSDDVRSQLIAAIKRKAKASAISSGAPEPKVVVSEGTPSLFNDLPLTARLQPAFEAAIGEANVITGDPVMGGEDFSQFGRAGVPSVLFWLGTVNQDRLDRYNDLGISPPSLHSSQFYPDIEESLLTGVPAMSAAVLELLGK